MLLLTFLCTSLGVTHAFPWVANQPGVDSSPFNGGQKRQQSGGNAPGGPATCPFNSNHQPAAPVTSEYSYNNAQNGLPGDGKGGFQVPAEGDTAHQYAAPGPNDIRGPCPGLNAAANHNVSIEILCTAISCSDMAVVLSSRRCYYL